jgi:hypothetical protein
MRLIDADKAKAELLRIAGDIHGWGEFFDGIRSGYQSAADRLDTMPTVEKRKHGYWKKEGSWYKCSCCNSAIDPWDNTWMKYCSCCGAIMDGKAICND